MYTAINPFDDDNHNPPSMNPPTATTLSHPQTRRKMGIGTRVWLAVSPTGRHLEEVGKHSIMKRTGLPARDLRVLDPMLSCPSTILGRERAIVVNLEHVRVIVTAKEVLMVASNNPLVVEFVDDLHMRVSGSGTNGVEKQATENMEVDMANNMEADSMKYSSATRSLRFFGSMQVKNNNSSKHWLNEQLVASPKLLPFEFRALEACLESACRCLDSETQTLELEAYPALDELTSQISTLNLERVRQIKSRLVAISGRVQKMRDELEHLLDDDNDMAEMYLTEKLSSQSMDSTPNGEDTHSNAAEDDRAESKSERASEIFSSSKPNIEELEMLLEAYFVQIDGILQKLNTMSEYVDDTEDCINIMLDDKQNQLLQMGVMLSTSILIMNAGIVVVGIFGMNIHIPLFDGQPIQFWSATIGTVGACVALYLLAYGWGKKKFLFA
ncbi:Magnesium transporter MRS2-F-like protein [Drosera capensis]